MLGPDDMNVGELGEERPLAVDGVEALRFLLREVLQPHRLDGEARLLDARQDLAGEPALDRVRLDDCECAFHLFLHGS